MAKLIPAHFDSCWENMHTEIGVLNEVLYLPFVWRYYCFRKTCQRQNNSIWYILQDYLQSNRNSRSHIYCKIVRRRAAENYGWIKTNRRTDYSPQTHLALTMRLTFAARHCAAHITCTLRTIGSTVSVRTLITLRSCEALFTRALTANWRAHTNRTRCIAFTRYARRTHARQYTVWPIIVRNAFIAIDTGRKILNARPTKIETKRKKEENSIRFFVPIFDLTQSKCRWATVCTHRAIQTDAAATVNAIRVDAETTLIHFRIVIAFRCVTITLHKMDEQQNVNMFGQKRTCAQRIQDATGNTRMRRK